jgi:hypothetical protein
MPTCTNCEAEVSPTSGTATCPNCSAALPREQVEGDPPQDTAPAISATHFIGATTSHGEEHPRMDVPQRSNKGGLGAFGQRLRSLPRAAKIAAASGFLGALVFVGDTYWPTILHTCPERYSAADFMWMRCRDMCNDRANESPSQTRDARALARGLCLFSECDYPTGWELNRLISCDSCRDKLASGKISSSAFSSCVKERNAQLDAQ